MMIHGSLRHAPNGRKRKTVSRKKYKAPFEPLVVSYSTVKKTGEPDRIFTGKPKEDFRKEISSKYTVAIAYNKGAYQVISPENIRDIGR